MFKYLIDAMLKSPSQEVNVKMSLEALIPCRCGNKNYKRGGFPDLVHCTGCGLIYYLVANKPVAQLIVDLANKS